LQHYDDPNYIELPSIGRHYLPKEQYDENGFEVRHEVDIDIDIARIVIEYRTQVLINANEKRYVAGFLESVTRPIQCGLQIKAHAVYLFQFQLMPYQSIQD
jgi:transposase